jgi:hypothetical protein
MSTGTSTAGSEPSRPAVSVVVPFAGPDAALAGLLSALGRLQVREDDEIIVADNRPAGHAAPASHAPIVLVDAAGLATPAFARNRGAASARNEWIAFIDADTVPNPTLLDDLFTPPPGPDTAILAGEIVDVAASPTLAARHGVARRRLSQRATLERPDHAYAKTANCTVRAQALAQVEGFVDTARAGEDADLCFRIKQAGWRLEYRPQATVSHLSRGSIRAAMAQLARHGSGAAWLERRYPGSMPAPGALELARRIAHRALAAGRALMRGEREQAAFALLDLAGTIAFELGRLLPNRPSGVLLRGAAGRLAVKKSVESHGDTREP